MVGELTFFLCDNMRQDDPKIDSSVGGATSVDGGFKSNTLFITETFFLFFIMHESVPPSNQTQYYHNLNNTMQHKD